MTEPCGLLGELAGFDRDRAGADADVAPLQIDFVHIDTLGWSGIQRLLADAKALDQLRVALRVLALEVIEQAPALADELQQAATRMMILRVNLNAR